MCVPTRERRGERERERERENNVIHTLLTVAKHKIITFALSSHNLNRHWLESLEQPTRKINKVREEYKLVKRRKKEGEISGEKQT